ncbi:MAG: DUF4124 domain-containing protein [Rhodoferax sp.]
MRAIPFWLSLLLSVVSVSAAAQWQWVDKDGRKVYSDLAPPSDIPEKNILKRPKGAAPASAPAGDAAPPAPTAGASAPTAPAKPSELDRKLEEKKKQAEKEAAAKKKADEERIAAARADNCKRARQSLATYQSGVRITRMNDKGEKEFVDDAERAAEVKRLQGIVQQDCR